MTGLRHAIFNHANVAIFRKIRVEVNILRAAGYLKSFAQRFVSIFL